MAAAVCEGKETLFLAGCSKVSQAMPQPPGSRPYIVLGKIIYGHGQVPGTDRSRRRARILPADKPPLRDF